MQKFSLMSQNISLSNFWEQKYATVRTKKTNYTKVFFHEKKKHLFVFPPWCLNLHLSAFSEAKTCAKVPLRAQRYATVSTQEPNYAYVPSHEKKKTNK